MDIGQGISPNSDDMNVMYLFSSIVTVVLFGLYILLVAYGIYSSAIFFFQTVATNVVSGRIVTPSFN